VIDLHFRATLTADQVVVVMLGNLIDQVPAAHVGGADQAILSQEFQRAIYGRFCQTGDILAGALIDFGRGYMPVRVVQDVQDCHPLGGHTKAARTQLGDVLVAAGHQVPYCKKYQ
jgi:hypothetical protein